MEEKKKYFESGDRDGEIALARGMFTAGPEGFRTNKNLIETSRNAKGRRV